MTPDEVQAARALVSTISAEAFDCKCGDDGVMCPGHVAEVASELVPQLLDALEQAQADLNDTRESLYEGNADFYTQKERADRAEAAVVVLQQGLAELNSEVHRLETAVVEARKAALHEAADAVEPEGWFGSEDPRSEWSESARMAAWLRARADAQGSTPLPTEANDRDDR